MEKMVLIDNKDKIDKKRGWHKWYLLTIKIKQTNRGDGINGFDCL